jgi:glycosyltransferase involved in cell wall biosynthesis
MTIPLTLSVVIPTHNRVELLLRNLTALAHQTCPVEAFEVIVVADACEDDTASAVLNYVQHAPYALCLLEHSARSASATRNLGAAHAKGQFLLFLDDDITPEPALIQAHIEAGGPDIVVLGYSKPSFLKDCDWWQQRARLWWEDAFSKMERPGHRFTFRDFFSGNVSLSAELFHSLGGFDLTISGRLEDYELGLRLLEAGARFSFVRAASGFHHEQTTLDIWLRRLYMEAKTHAYIGERYPALRNVLFSEHFGDSYLPESVVRKLRALSFRYPKLHFWTLAALLRLTHLSESLRWRGPYWYMSRALRELAYWGGVAETFKSEDAYQSYLQEGPSPVSFLSSTPTVDLALTPMTAGLDDALREASRSGILITFDGVEVMTISPEIGAEALQTRHLRQGLQDLAINRFFASPTLQRFLFSLEEFR